jgi:carbon storage regulator
MLILTRKPQEAIAVGVSPTPEQVIKVTILDVRDGRVKLGVEARREVPIHRWEVWERITNHFDATCRPARANAV